MGVTEAAHHFWGVRGGRQRGHSARFADQNVLLLEAEQTDDGPAIGSGGWGVVP